MITSLIPSFNAGELSPLIHLRSDLEKYRSGCRTLQNMMITPYGGARRRAGLSYTATAPGPCRLFRFQASISKGFILELSDELMRFYLRDSLILDDDDDVYTVETPYAAEDLWGIQTAQINNVAYFVHPDYPPYKLSRIADNEWEFLPVDFSYPPMMSENLRKNRKFTTSAAGEAGELLGLESSFNFFSNSHVGAYMTLSHEREPDQFEVELDATSGNDGLFSPELIIQGAWNLSTRGTWDGTFELQRNSGSGWSTIRSFVSESDANFTAGGTESSRVLMRLKWTHGASGSSNPKAVLEASGAFITGLVKIFAVISPTEAQIDVIEPVEAGETSYWREGSWSDKRGFPRTVAAHEQRLVFGGNRHQPQTIWASAVDDYEEFRPGVEDSDSWNHTLVSGQQNDIQWLVSQKSLLIGTSGDEWVISATKEEAVITPTNVRARRHSGNGSDFIKAKLLDSSVLFVQRGGKVVREMSYSFEADGYQTADLTLLAEHITGGRIIDMAWQAQPESVLWCVTGNGDLIALTYDKGQNIAGWHRHVTGTSNADGFESVAIKSVEGEADQVWVSVRRTIGGSAVRYIERFKPDGFFLEEPWSMLWPDTEGILTWATKYNSYEIGFIGDVVEVGNRAYLCVINHTMDETFFIGGMVDWYNHVWRYYEPPHATREWVTIYKWTEGEGTSGPFSEGMICHHGGVVYMALASSYETSPETEPGVGASWAFFWEVFTEYPAMPVPIPPIIVSGQYVENDIVRVGDRLYQALSDHFPNDDNEPTVGVSWETYWQGPLQGEYQVGDLVSSRGKNYICTEDHAPTAATRPAYGADWGDVWDLVTDDNLIFYVDSGVTLINPGEITEMEGLDHLEGETVQIVANGAVLPPRVVSGGAIQFDQEGDPTTFTDVSAGLAYESILEPMALEVGMQNGTSVSREKRIHELVIYFKDSYGCKVSDRLNGTFDTMAFYDTSDGNSPTLFSGPKLHKLDSRHDLEASFVIKQDLPMPFQVLAIVPKWNVYGDNI